MLILRVVVVCVIAAVFGMLFSMLIKTDRSEPSPRLTPYHLGQ